MIEVLRPEPIGSAQMVQGWTLSLALHLGLIAALLLMPKLTIVLDQEPFSWEVSLVHQPQETAADAASASVSSAPKPHASRVETPRPVKPAPATSRPRVAQQESAQVVHPMEPPKPQSVLPAQDLLPAPITPTPTPDVRKAEIEEAPPVPKEVVKQETVKEQEPVREAVTEPVAPRETYSVPELSHTQALAQAHEAPPAGAGPPPAAILETAHSSPPTAPAVDTAKPSEMPPTAANPPATSTDLEPPMQVAKAAPQALSRAPEAKADHRWVGESLWRRVAELKRYPSTARLNGLEGRVVLKAIIRADGHLAEVSVVKSSGHAVLDAAAMEAVKLACPLHMKHSIGPPQIVVSLPIVYSLAN